MKKSIVLPRGPRQQEFLDYFNAGVRARSSQVHAEAGFLDDRQFVTRCEETIEIDGVSARILWELRFDPQGTLDEIRVDCKATSVRTERWESIVNGFLQDALIAAQTERREKYFCRRRFSYIGPVLDGEYWLPRCRLGAVAADVRDTRYDSLSNMVRVVLLDAEILAIGGTHAQDLATEFSHRLFSRLAVLTEVGFSEDSAQGIEWGLPHGEDTLPAESVRYYKVYADPEVSTRTTMPTKGELATPGRYEESLESLRPTWPPRLTLPQETRKILRALDSAPVEARDAFDRCARLYRVALVIERTFPSVGVAYRVAAVEALAKGSAARSSFADLIRRYTPEFPNKEPVIDNLYGYARSGHFHAGEFPAGEFNAKGAAGGLMSIQEMKAWDVRMQGRFVCRAAIINWLLQLLRESGR
jgi:hypothetical protein